MPAGAGCVWHHRRGFEAAAVVAGHLFAIYRLPLPSRDTDPRRRRASVLSATTRQVETGRNSANSEPCGRARQIARERGIQEGLVCTLGSVEMHASFEHRRTIMVRRKRPCHVLYQYQYHPQVGWMYARIQTWFPFRIQVGLNGREWLAQQMRRENLKFRQADN